MAALDHESLRGFATALAAQLCLLPVALDVRPVPGGRERARGLSTTVVSTVDSSAVLSPKKDDNEDVQLAFSRASATVWSSG